MRLLTDWSREEMPLWGDVSETVDQLVKGRCRSGGMLVRLLTDWSTEEMPLWGDVSEIVDNLKGHSQLAFGTPEPQ